MPLPTPTLAPETKTRLDNELKRLVDDEGSLATCFLAAANVKEIIYENQLGNRVHGDESSGKVNQDSVLQLWSLTKSVVAVGALRLVDQGQLDLDDPEVVAKWLPEISNLKILEGYSDASLPPDEQKPGNEIWAEPRTRITVRMLLSHTAGLGYDLFHPLLKRYQLEHPRPTMMTKGASPETYVLPLIYDPGSSWQYSVALDWVGCLITRLTGMPLEDYLQKELFKPLGISSITFVPTPEIRARLLSWSVRGPDGKLYLQEGLPMGRAFTAEDLTDQSGGGGLFGSLHDYLLFYQALLACSPDNDVEPKHRLVSKESFKLLFEPILPFPYKLRPPIDPKNPPVDQGNSSNAGQELSNIVNFGFGWDPPATPAALNHSVAFAIHTEAVPGGRAAGTGGWFGLLRTPACIDVKNGLVIVGGTQELSAVSPDHSFPKIYHNLETILYSGLQGL